MTNVTRLALLILISLTPGLACVNIVGGGGSEVLWTQTVDGTEFLNIVDMGCCDDCAYRVQGGSIPRDPLLTQIDKNEAIELCIGYDSCEIYRSQLFEMRNVYSGSGFSQIWFDVIQVDGYCLGFGEPDRIAPLSCDARNRINFMIDIRQTETILVSTLDTPMCPTSSLNILSYITNIRLRL